jgi:hypothetical protein
MPRFFLFGFPFDAPLFPDALVVWENTLKAHRLNDINFTLLLRRRWLESDL